MTDITFPKGWSRAELQQLVYFQRGFDITKAQQQPGDVPVISSSGVTSFHCEAKVQGPGIVIGRKGTLGSIHYSDCAYWPHDTTLWSRSLHGNNARFVYYYLHLFNFQHLDVGNANPTLNRNHIHKLEVAIPPKKTQDAIADILSAYDELTTTNQRCIALLEDAARRVYREWFVHLRFPGHEQVKVKDGVPEGWNPSAFADLVEINPKNTFEKNIERPFVEMSALSERSMVIGPRSTRLIGGGAKFRNGDTLFARITPCIENGKTGFVQFLEDDSAVASGSTEFIVFRSRKVNPWWVYCTAREDDFRQSAIRSMSGSDGRQRVNPKCFAQYFVPRPPQVVLSHFEEAVANSFHQIENLHKQNEVLARARDLLLPKLMSGQIDVSHIPLPEDISA